MEEEDDDFYDPVDTVPPAQPQNHAHNAAPQDSNDMEEVEVEEEDDVRSTPACSLC